MVLTQRQKSRSMEQDRKHSLFNKRYWENWTATCKRIKLEYSLTPCTKINSKWIKDLDVRWDTIKFLKENISRTLFDINCSKIFLHPTPRVMKIKTKRNKWDLVKLKSFCRASLVAQWASLVAQWLRICLPMQGTRVQALVWEDPTCHGATRPMSHNY